MNGIVMNKLSHKANSDLLANEKVFELIPIISIDPMSEILF